jgi:uncharacterized protein (TIGR02145 family)
MNRKKFRTSVLITSMVIIFSSCNKDIDDPSSTNGKTTAVFNSSVTYGTLTDQDGNMYKTVTIGTQTWMAENLRTTKYNDSTSIPNVTDASTWTNLTTGAYCNYNNTTFTDTIATNGRLYNWFAVNSSKLAPKGWHVATDAEWTTLTTYLGGSEAAGDKLKEIGASHWKRFLPGRWVPANDTVATNSTGFTALPGGGHNIDGTFSCIGTSGVWWTATENYGIYAFNREMINSDGAVYWAGYDKRAGFSVRCVKD